MLLQPSLPESFNSVTEDHPCSLQGLAQLFPVKCGGVCGGNIALLAVGWQGEGWTGKQPFPPTP